MLILSGNIIAEQHGEGDVDFLKSAISLHLVRNGPRHPEMGLRGTFDFILKAASREEHEAIHSGAEKAELTFWL